jgi:YVTN family beta-propeller protein
MSRPGSRTRRAGIVLAVTLVALAAAWALKQPEARPSRAVRDIPQRRLEPPEPAGAGIVLGRVVQDGLKVECRVTPLNQPGARSVFEGEDVRFEFSVSDTAGGAPLAKANPAAWVVARPEGTGPPGRKEGARIAASLLQGGLFNRPEVDLNAFYVVTLNQDETLSVVDPRFGYGGTKLLALIPLAARGDDWVLDPAGRRLFVAMPGANQVAAIDTRTWKVIANFPGGVNPHRIGLQPDGRYLWVAGGVETRNDSGVTALDPDDGRVVARIKTGRGRHDLAFSDDSRFAFVTSAAEGTVSVIDTEALRESATIRTGTRPVSVAYSSRARLAYVADATDGTVAAIDPSGGRLVTRIELVPGVSQIRFSPDGRAGFAVNPERDVVSVIDPTTSRVVQSVKVEGGPDQVTFTGGFAYIRQRRDVSIVMIALENAGREGAPLPVVRFPAGERPPGAMDDPTPADSIVAAPGSGAVLVANPGDRSVYYYKEGMSAPLGTFSNYKRAPRAVLVIDLSLRERDRRGVYETAARLDRPGQYDVIFFLDQPRIVHSFPVEAKVDPALELARNKGKIDVRPLVLMPRAGVGRPFRPLFQMSERTGGSLKLGLTDVELLMYRVGGDWQERSRAREFAPGVYGADFLPDRPGIYYVSLACGSAGLSVNDSQRVVLRVEDPAADGPPTGLNPPITAVKSPATDHSRSLP